MLGSWIAACLRGMACWGVTPATRADRLTRELRAAGAIRPAIQVTPVPEIQREGGHGAKVKLIQATA